MRATFLLPVVALSSCTVMKGEERTNNETSCHAARLEMQRAVDAYTMLEMKPPANEMEMVPRYLLVASPLMDLDGNGNVVPAPGTGCP